MGRRLGEVWRAQVFCEALMVPRREDTVPALKNPTHLKRITN